MFIQKYLSSHLDLLRTADSPLQPARDTGKVLQTVSSVPVPEEQRGDVRGLPSPQHSPSPAPSWAAAAEFFSSHAKQPVSGELGGLDRCAGGGREPAFPGKGRLQNTLLICWGDSCRRAERDQDSWALREDGLSHQRSTCFSRPGSRRW